MLRALLQRIFGSLSHNDQLIQKLADSYPVRNAARYIVYIFFRGQSIVQESGLNKRVSLDRVKKFVDSIKTNFKNELEDAKNKLKQK